MTERETMDRSNCKVELVYCPKKIITNCQIFNASDFYTLVQILKIIPTGGD